MFDEREVLTPIVDSRIEQRHKQTGIWVDRCDVRTFVSVAASAGQSQVFCIIGTAVLTGTKHPHPALSQK